MNNVSLRFMPMPGDRYEMRLSGSGGQGMMLAALILAEAIGADPAKNVTQTKSYGPEARGGASKADLVVSTGEIYYPKAIKLDLLLAMTQESMDKYHGDLKDHGTLIVDDSLVTNIPTDRYYGVPFTRLAREEVGNVVVANMMVLGAIAAITHVVTLEALLKVVMVRAPRGTEETNRKALEIGYREGVLREAEMAEAPSVLVQMPAR
jgi:2-oxoglutarate ferredoxin oxidoreductase subunit gamma